jgi:hypothetical protein
MRRILIEHIGSIAFVTFLFVLVLGMASGSDDPGHLSTGQELAPYLQIPGLDLSQPADRALFRETLNAFRPDSTRANEELITAIQEYRQSRFTDPTLKAGADERGLSASVLRRLSGMYLQFIIVYVIVLVLSFYLAQTLALFRFVRYKQGRDSYVIELVQVVRGRGPTGVRAWKNPGGIGLLLLKALGKGIAYIVLFSPGYVIGYAVKTSVDVDSIVFMVLLGVISNGLVITNANAFTTLLIAESRKGYVDTALVKNLSGIFAWHVPGGLRLRSLIRLPRRFPGHVLQHIYLNARHQYLPALKMQASFLITGLIIIEMALNIQGHLCYELLQTLLYKHYAQSCAIVFGIFLLVKMTEIAVDVYQFREGARYDNRA